MKIIGLFLLILVGCAKVSKDDLAKLSGPVDLKAISEGAVAREFFEEGGWPTERWWEMFEDPQLNGIIERALKESPTLQKALAKVAETAQEAKKQKAALFPHFAADYLEQWNYFSKNGLYRSFFPEPPGAPPIPATDNQIDLTLNFKWEIDFFGKNRNLYKSALNAAWAEIAESKQATLILTTLITQTYIELQTKLIQKEIMAERVKERENLFELSGLRAENGLDPLLPVLEREERVYRIQQSLIQIEKEIALDRHMLSVLVGVGPEQDLALEPMQALFERPFPLPENLTTDLLARRPDLMAQIWRVESSAAKIGAAKADFYPSFNLLAFGGLESLTFNKLLSWSSREGALVPAVHLPIWTGGKLTANLKKQVALFNEETYRYNELVLTAAREVSDEIATLTATFDILSQQINTLEAVEEQMELQYLRYRNGVGNFLSVLERVDDLCKERIRLFSEERNYLLAVLKLVKALGGGYHGKPPEKRGS